jgi:multiple sugar transport system ATP-binding protein
LGIRAEDFTPEEESPEHLAVEVDLVEALGNDTYLLVHLVANPTLSLQVRVAPEHRLRLGDRLWLGIAIDKIHLFDAKTEKSLRTL